jgi:predicted NUDIX family phosphoesterase
VYSTDFSLRYLSHYHVLEHEDYRLRWRDVIPEVRLCFKGAPLGELEMGDDLEKLVTQLEGQAEHVRSLLALASRAFVIEFAGTPKSGKTTAVEAIRHFLSRQGFRVYVLTERAAICPIPMKGHLFFNTWCASSMLAELLANVETPTDVLIVDRGIFDALVWLTLQEKRGELNATEARTIESFLLLPRWRDVIDLVVVMSVSAEDSLKRELDQRITQKMGSIMNPEVLGALVSSVDEAAKRYQSRFRSLLRLDTTGKKPRESNVELASQVLNRLEAYLNPEILVVPRKDIESLYLHEGGAFDVEHLAKLLKTIDMSGHFIRRAEAESRADCVQIIPSGVLTYGGEIFLFQRKETDPKYRLYGRATIWQGAHVQRRETGNIRDLLEPALLERISQSLFLSRLFPVFPLGYAWDRDDERSSRHLGLIYRIEIDNPHTATDLRKKEFRRQRGHGLLGQFVPAAELVAQQGELSLETWSQAILNNVEEKQWKK